MNPPYKKGFKEWGIFFFSSFLVFFDFHPFSRYYVEEYEPGPKKKRYSSSYVWRTKIFAFRIFLLLFLFFFFFFPIRES